MFHNFTVGQRIADDRGYSKLLQFLCDIRHSTISNVRHALFERHAEYRHLRTTQRMTGSRKKLNCAPGNECSHRIVYTPPSQNNFRMVAEFLSLRGQIIGIDPDTMPSNEAWAEL